MKKTFLLIPGHFSITRLANTAEGVEDVPFPHHAGEDEKEPILVANINAFLHVHVHDNKASFSLEYNAGKTNSYATAGDKYGNEAPMIGKPWGYADQKKQFAWLKNNPDPEKIIFWANELEITVLKSNIDFSELSSLLCYW